VLGGGGSFGSLLSGPKLSGFGKPGGAFKSDKPARPFGAPESDDDEANDDDDDGADGSDDEEGGGESDDDKQKEKDKDEEPKLPSDDKKKPKLQKGKLPSLPDAFLELSANTCLQLLWMMVKPGKSLCYKSGLRCS
jgi:hypothetical protein